ncbi:MAG: glycosyltransferase family 9 protein [Gammaproteobacteria bacterium]|nr:glycosyltransferase family 9 protein [Gammaproteobacteria bacterium]
MPDFTTEPKSICILRLSAIGDICHTLPIMRTIQANWPKTTITWIIGKTEYELIKSIPDINFIVFDKKKGFKEYLRIRTQLNNIQFDLLLHMQMSLRASLISLMIKTKVKIGFDRKRAKDGQWLFTNKKINPGSHQHVIDSLFGFSEILGIKEHKLIWDIPIPEGDRISANTLISNRSNYIIISPCSSKDYRNWNTQGYASIVDYIAEKYHYDIILTGGNSETEKRYGNEIIHSCKFPPLNLIGRTNLNELLSIIAGAKCMISPDSGPAHMSTAVGTPVIGLYATTNPDRARPYLSAEWVINRYPEAIYKKYHKKVNDVAWGTRVRDDWAMNMITVEDVKYMIDKFFKQLPGSK